MRVLVFTSEPIDEQVVYSLLGDDVRVAEIIVVAPATNRSPLAYWVSDSDAAIAEADTAVTDTVERLEEAGVPALGETGESDPELAVRDALAKYPRVDRIVVVRHSPGENDYREERTLEAARSAGLPVDVAEVSRP